MTDSPATTLVVVAGLGDLVRYRQEVTDARIVRVTATGEQLFGVAGLDTVLVTPLAAQHARWPQFSDWLLTRGRDGQPPIIDYLRPATS